jgi:ubiquinol-cytochrome c reductase cytochrome b subunit
VKDIVGVVGFLIIFCAILFFAPEMGGFFIEHPNFEPANPLKTPEHIAPVWYFTPFYAILRAVPDKLMGVGAMFAAIALLFFMPWIDRCKVRSIRYRAGIYKVNLTMFIISFVVLGWLAMQPATPTLTLMSQIFSFIYFAFFVVLYITSKNENTKPVPDRVTS